jgi:hypothetical protein
MLSALVLTAVPLEFRAPLRCAPGTGSFSKNFGTPRNVVAPLSGVALRRRLRRVVPFLRSSPVPNVGQWSGLPSRRM